MPDQSPQSVPPPPPHPPPSPPLSPPSPPALPPSPPIHPPNPLLTQARVFASHSFESHVNAVLQHASISYLRRSLSERTEAFFRHLPQEQLASESSTHELLAQDPHLLTISDNDLEQSYHFAERVGSKWGEVLQRQGYFELAEIATHVVKKGNFLGTSTASGPTSANDGENKPKKHLSSFTAMRALRRYPPVCDKSGIPLKYVPADLDTDDDEDNLSNNKLSSARKVIQQIDEMVLHGGSGELWPEF